MPRDSPSTCTSVCVRPEGRGSTFSTGHTVRAVKMFREKECDPGGGGAKTISIYMGV